MPSFRLSTIAFPLFDRSQQRQRIANPITSYSFLNLGLDLCARVAGVEPAILPVVTLSRSSAILRLLYYSLTSAATNFATPAYLKNIQIYHAVFSRQSVCKVLRVSVKQLLICLSYPVIKLQ